MHLFQEKLTKNRMTRYEKGTAIKENRGEGNEKQWIYTEPTEILTINGANQY
jgi:hypothetical protein